MGSGLDRGDDMDYNSKKTKFQVGNDGLVECPECGSIIVSFWQSKVAGNILNYVYFTCKNGHKYCCGFIQKPVAGKNGEITGEHYIEFSCWLLYESDDNSKINYKEYLLTPEWKAKANAAKERAGHRCQLCNAEGNNGFLHAHHRTYERLGEELPEDIIVLCKDCHAKFHDKA